MVGEPEGRKDLGAANGPAHDADHGLDEPTRESLEEPGGETDEFIVTAATIAAVGVGVVILEAALLPGLILGVAATLAPKYLPQVGGALTPLFKATVRGAYTFGQKAYELAAEAQEQVHDVVAELRAEAEGKANARENRETSMDRPKV